MYVENMDVEVRLLPNYELGLFAVRNFRIGETVLGLPTITQPEPDKYSIEAWPGVHLDCSEHPAGYLNHSCNDANVAVKGGAVIAWRCIEKGEQLFLDYRKTEAHLAAPFICACCDREMKW